MGARLLFSETATGRPRVEAVDPTDALLADFLSAERGHLDEIERALTDVIEVESPLPAWRHEVWWLKVTPEKAEITFEYEDEPFVLPPNELLDLVRAWRTFVQASPA